MTPQGSFRPAGAVLMGPFAASAERLDHHQNDDQHHQQERAADDGEEGAEGGSEDGLEEIFHGGGVAWAGVVGMMLSCLLFANQKLTFNGLFPLDAACIRV